MNNKEKTKIADEGTETPKEDRLMNWIVEHTLLGVMILIGLCYGLTLGSLAISGHYEGTRTLFLVSGWFFVIVLLVWAFAEVIGDGQDNTGGPWNGLYLNKVIVVLPVLVFILIIFTVGKFLLSSWNINLGLGSFSIIFIINGALLSLLSYYLGVTPYRVQWLKWHRHGRKTTRYQIESPGIGDAHGWHPGRVGPFTVNEWIFEFIYNWTLYIIGNALFACGFALLIF